MGTDFRQRPHRRYNPLNGEWVLVSPQRALRPWQGQVERVTAARRPPYDPECYLCPGNLRASGERNPNYQHTFVFVNDFSALLPDTPLKAFEDHPLLRAVSVPGECRVLCFSPRHDLSLAEMEVEAILHVVDAWIEQTEELGKRFRWVQIFENKGEMMGCSNPHPHGQIWALEALPNEVLKEHHQQTQHYRQNRRPLLLEYVELELQQAERVVVENEDWLVVTPFWAIWPFETLLLPKSPVLRLTELKNSQRLNLAAILKRLLAAYDRLFNTSFPYSMGWHGAPFLEENVLGWQLHAHFYPPLLRSATVRKFMVGFEMLAEAQRDITPEQAAARLREVLPS
ncbi:MAG: UDP-glucose--hexose-1-phosphate uridylyltransferase [Anaerolineales bacterium]|nr:UDP-glucose--hexose-1-phosphate uridylyltransferase [Anaerolineales bacterium]MCS7247835.1 UDP-glucose--hexose-1-phosphate uridylyltransferase [Anaerolineales bacterium]MDW8161645.1 UDP-glucose--hexose-1-phosphate uridylyltransferase [Anaerolineales bacterium]MDW8447480.1 UDP-glucose--hexose-1-phosphate uridylyltransferase [Anaerolineales bacterium]